MIATSARRRGFAALVFAVLGTASAGWAASQAIAASDATITVTVQGIGNVLIKPSDITCTTKCTAVVSAGTEVTLEATPGEGFVLAAWHGPCEGVAGDTCVIQPEAEAAVTAVFAAASVTTTGTTTATTTTTPTTVTGPPPPTATVPPPPIGTLPGHAADAVSNAVRALPSAFVAFNVPRTLGRNETATIQLLLSPTSKSIGDLQDRLSEAGEQVGGNIKYSSVMEAVLLSQDFEITSVDHESRKLVPSDQDTEWLWQVTPRRSGTLRLYLTVYAIIDVAGDEGPVKVGTFHRTLTINVTWTQRAGDFLKGNWQWLWTAVLVPLGLWAARRRTKPRPPAPTSRDPAPNAGP